MMRKYGYVRTSSKDQNEERQIKALIEAGVDERFIFVDKQSGKDFNREQYLILKNALRDGDILVVKSIDRFGRNYSMIIDEWRDITLNIKADIKVLDIPLLDTTQHKDLLGNFISELTLQVLSFVSEQERAFIKQRQSEGIAIAMKKGIKFGRRKIEKPNNWNEVIKKWNSDKITAVEAMKELNLKKTTFYKLLRDEKGTGGE